MKSAFADIDLPSLVSCLNTLITCARSGDWEQVTAHQPQVSLTLSMLQRKIEGGFENKPIFPVDRKNLEEINLLLAVAAPLCESRRNQIAPLVGQLKPLPLPEGQ